MPWALSFPVWARAPGRIVDAPMVRAERVARWLLAGAEPIRLTLADARCLPDSP
ncbi:hypothetical protein RZS08_06915 [Arthrospira platensis SPKY1]|nr:hypothetical protein [Arthrospira platensis SPKY1]